MVHRGIGDTHMLLGHGIDTAQNLKTQIAEQCHIHRQGVPVALTQSMLDTILVQLIVLYIKYGRLRARSM